MTFDATPIAAPSHHIPLRPPPGTLDRDAFWRFADQAKEATETLAAQRMRTLVDAPVDVLRHVCLQYRFFTLHYIQDLALLLARLPFGGLRSLLAQILSEELGEGDPDKAHPAVYDRFLASIGVPAAQLERCLPDNRATLETLTAEMTRRSAAFGVGLRGMGGECLCQTYLATMHAHLRAHPWVCANEARIDWDFWTIHAGEADIVHAELTRRAIDEYLCEAPDVLPDLAAGYERSIGAWNAFWAAIFDSTPSDAAPLPARTLS